MAIPTSSSGSDFGAAPGNRTGGGRYLLKRLVGRGDFSEVWLARDVKNSRDLALKFLPRAFLPDKNLLELFQREVNRNQLLQHPHIIAAGELVLDYDTAAIAMEFVDGWSLASMKVDKLTHCYNVAEIKTWVHELCEALAYAHKEFGLVHGDLKPSNLLASTREGIKVTDFGFAALLRSESSKRGMAKSGNGGMGFLSPQQVMGEPPSKLDDIYSLGATIYDLLTGTPPFYKGEVIAQICSLQPARMTQRLAELGVQCDPVPPVWEETIAACLAKNPADRPQSVEKVWQLLERKEVPVSATPQSDEPANDVEPPATPEITTEVPPLTQQPSVSQTSSKLIALAFAGAVVLFLIAALAVAVAWLSGKAKVVSSTESPPTGGLLDESFNPGTGADNGIRSIALQPDGKILIGGLFTNFNGVVSRRIARLNPDGTLDPEFLPSVPGHVYAIALEANGKMLIGGQGVRNGRPNRRVVQLDADGTRDTTFHGEGVYNGNVEAITLLPDGGAVVGGRFTKIGNKERNGLTRLTPDDEYDDSFNLNMDEATVLSIAAQPDGKILAAGSFKDVTGRASGLVRLNPDGSFDSGFNDGGNIYAEISVVLLQKDGRILICGNLNSTNGLFPYLARLNPDGSLDGGFHFSSSLNGSLECLALQADGKIIIGGHSIADGKSHPFLARLNTDGTPDGTFQTTSTGGDSVWMVAVQPDQKIVVAGLFTNFDGEPCGNIIRLQN